MWPDSLKRLDCLEMAITLAALRPQPPRFVADTYFGVFANEVCMDLNTLIFFFSLKTIVIHLRCFVNLSSHVMTIILQNVTLPYVLDITILHSVSIRYLENHE